jgi:hypothetical protein
VDADQTFGHRLAAGFEAHEVAPGIYFGALNAGGQTFRRSLVRVV